MRFKQSLWRFSRCPAVALYFVEQVTSLAGGHSFPPFPLILYRRPRCWLDPLNGSCLCLPPLIFSLFLSLFSFSYSLKHVSACLVLRRSMVLVLPELLSRYLSSCHSIAGTSLGAWCWRPWLCHLHTRTC